MYTLGCTVLDCTIPQYCTIRGHARKPLANAVRSFRTHQSAGLRGKGFLSQRLQFGTLIVLPRFTYNDSFTRLFVFVETVSLLEMLLWNVEALSAEAERCRRSLLERR